MFGAAYRSLTNLAEVVENTTLAANISSTVLVGIASDWKEDREFERSALSASRKEALSKLVEAKKQRLASK